MLASQNILFSISNTICPYTLVQKAYHKSWKW